MGKVKVSIQAVIEIEADRDFVGGEHFENIKKIGTREALDNLNKMIELTEFKVKLVKSPSVVLFTYIDKF